MRFCVLICIKVRQFELQFRDKQLPPTLAVKWSIFYTSVGICIVDKLPREYTTGSTTEEIWKCDVRVYLHLDIKFKFFCGFGQKCKNI